MTEQSNELALLPGDRVALASTGQEMTVREINDDGVHCFWREAGETRQAAFKRADLKLLEERN